MLRYLTTNERQNLVFSETELPLIRSDECLIRVKAIGINRADILQKQGKYPPPRGESEILGIEVSGDIHALGDESNTRNNDWNIGDRVIAIVPGGAYAEYVKVKIAHLIRLPQQYTYQEGAALPEAFLTAYQCLFSIANLADNSQVLIHAGASGVGSAAIQLAKKIGCDVTVTVGSEEKVTACLAMGANAALNYQHIDFSVWAKEHKPNGFDVILDVVAGDYVNKNISVCATDGHIVMLSMLGGRFAERVDIAKMLIKRVNMHATTLRSRSEHYKTTLINAFHKRFYHDFSANELKPIIHQCYTWHQANEAHDIMTNNVNIGKLILNVD